MAVGQSLSRGLADRVILELQKERSGLIKVLRRAYARIPRKRSDVRSMVEELKLAGEKASLAQVISHHPKWRWAAINAFLPVVGETGSGKSNRLVTFEIIRMQIQNERYTNIPVSTTVLGIQEHAIERLFLRLNVMSAAQVREEVHDSMCLSILLCAAALKLELKQVVLPTKSGAFLCSTVPEKKWLIAKTWLSATDQRDRVKEVAQAVLETYEGYGGESGIAKWLSELPINSDVRSIKVSASLAERLGRFHWLRKQYAPRPDPEGEKWINARMQTLHSKI